MNDETIEIQIICYEKKLFLNDIWLASSWSKAILYLHQPLHQASSI